MAAPAKRVLDTDALSAVMRNVPLVVARVRAYLEIQSTLSFSVITRYEVLRGLEAKSAGRQKEAFARFCAASEILYLTDSVIDTAARIYANLKHRGELIGDADVLIAATALENNAGLVTGNERHFRRVPGLHVENWLV